MNSGIYYRIERDGKWQSVDLVEMTNEERAKLLHGFNKPYLILVIAKLLQIFREIEVEKC